MNRVLAPVWLAVAVCVGSALAHVATSTMPFQIGALINGGGAAAGLAGLFGFLQIGALSASMVLIAPWMGRFAPAAVAACGCALIVGGDLGLYLASSPVAHLPFAVIAGAGYGLTFAATIAGAAVSPEPDRLYALGNGGSLLIIVLIMTTLPAVAARLGPLAVFGSLGALALVSAPLLTGLGTRRVEGSLEGLEVSGLHLPGGPGLILCWVMLSTGTGGLYAFCERIGHSRGLPAQAIANVLSAGAFIGLIGTGAAMIFGSRINRRLALIAGLAGSGLACLLIGFSSTLAAFAAGVATYWVFYMFLYSYLMGTAALLDPTGRLGTLGAGLERLGYASGVWMAGVLAERVSYSATGVLGFAGCVVAGLGLPSVFRALADRTRAAPAAA
jgi:hypothetical protein